ncbi:hypothetical protein K2173_026086 [Erythroxylum novogranatense]|uniref:Integrase zinc-binding domain-containing protein n=1 Tax=Erythroxylum novogranatense TaxID=1862640 RepID=A0AAV8SI00_9ROSI|nr:hypothetical protein K2173_026086 [Erythroxylum novogranatense]
MERVRSNVVSDFELRDGTLWMGQRLCVPDVDGLRHEILEEAHVAAYAMHPGITKMYHTLKLHFWWPGMKRQVAEFVSRCLTCQQVKAEHQAPVGKLHSLPIPEWKWDRITMDFIIGLPRTPRQYDVIWTERTIKTVEDILRACVLEFRGAWDQYLPLVEFAYNNQYQSSIDMAPYEALYGRQCRSPLYWDEEGMRMLEGPELIQDTVDKVQLIRSRIKAA